jgi:MbtH protein
MSRAGGVARPVFPVTGAARGPDREREAVMTDTDELYVIVRNDEEQYSIWRSGQPVPAGWEPVGEPGPREDCLARIGELWTDMRPASLRAAMSNHR